MRHKTFFWFFLPTGLAMLLFIALPIVSVLIQSVFAPHEAVLVEVENCTPLVGCTIETSIDQEATRELRAAQPLGRFVGLDIYFDRGHIAVAEVSQLWAETESWGAFWDRLSNLPFYRALAFTLTFTFVVTPSLIILGLIVLTTTSKKPMEIDVVYAEKEGEQLEAQVKQKGLTLVPLSAYLKNGKVKISIGVCQGKTKGDKRESLKKAEADRSISRAMRSRQK